MCYSIFFILADDLLYLSYHENIDSMSSLLNLESQKTFGKQTIVFKRLVSENVIRGNRFTAEIFPFFFVFVVLGSDEGKRVSRMKRKTIGLSCQRSIFCRGFCKLTVLEEYELSFCLLLEWVMKRII